MQDLEKLRVNLFKIVIPFGGKSCSLQVEQSYLSASKEVFTIIDGNATFQITSDRPLIKSNPNSRKKPSYKAVDARLEQLNFFERVISEIQSHLHRLDNPPFDWSSHPKNNPY